MPKVAQRPGNRLRDPYDRRCAITSKPMRRSSSTSLDPWLAAIARLKATYRNTDVASTEPVADYMLGGGATHNLTPFRFQGTS